MEDLRSHATLLDLIFHHGIADPAIGRILDKVVESLRAIRETGLRRGTRLRDIPTQRDPFTARLRERLTAVVKSDPALQPIFTHPGRVLGQPCPPLDELLAAAARFMDGVAGKVAPVLQHGDPHLGNLMVRARGRGHSVKLIDPNPNVGFTDPLYDAGKLVHWAEPVGWAKVRPAACHADWHCGRSGWELDARCTPPATTAERRRAVRLEERIPRLLADESPETLRRRLPLAIAAAHAGLAARLTGEPARA